MYLTCPECYTSFVVSADQIGPKGRRVRCSKCNHGWFASPVKSKAAPKKKNLSFNPTDRVGKSEEKFEKGVNLPALLPISIPFYLYFLPIMLLCAVIFSSLLIFNERLELLGMSRLSKDLSVHDVNIAYDKPNGNIIASYKIVNKSEHIMPLSSIRIRLLDHNHRILKTHIANESHAKLESKQFVTVKTNFSDAPPNVEYIDITLGNKLDFFLR
jgi:predicted Zn finger-like uncharacterized protein